MILFNIFLGFLALFLVLFYFIRKRGNFWLVKGVPFVKPSIPFGNFKGIGQNVHFADAFTRFYKELKGKFPYGGLFMSFKPVVIVTDLDLIKNIMIKDFNYFTDHGMYYNEKDDPLSHNLFSMEGAPWKTLRAKLSPTFTSGKMKTMFPTMAAVGVELKNCIDRELKISCELEMKAIVGRFTTDIIASCAFGIESNSLLDPLSKFNTMGVKFFTKPNMTGIKLPLIIAFQDTARKFGIKVIADDVSKFYTNIVKETIAYREKTNEKRNDFMNLMLQLKNKGKLDDDSTENKNDFITTQEIINQSFVFFIAGFETSSATMSFALNELVANQDIQFKLRKEIYDVLEKHDGQITYDSIMEMKYLEQVIYETLRKYPVLSVLIRIAVSDYLVPGTKTVIEKERPIFIPIYAIQHDPEYYPDPEKFDPERFTTESVHKRHPMTFLSFGDGPRICIGQRFGLMQTKLGLVTLLMNYKFTKTNKTNYPVIFDNASMPVLISPKGGVFANIEKI